MDDSARQTVGIESAVATGRASGLIVGIGASAGGLAAFQAFFTNLPPDSGMSFVLVQHLSPDHKSLLTEILARSASIPVIQAENGMAIKANHVYVIPPDATLVLKSGKLEVVKPAPPRERRHPIDTFFTSLAGEQGDQAVCIVLAGTGSDGTLGLTAIKESGGLTMAQAEFDHTAMSGMPHNATKTGLVDYVLPVEEMPAKLIEYRDHLALVANRKDDSGARSDIAGHLDTITALLRVKTGHDFTKYKGATVGRRIQRRMQVLQADTFAAYIERLQNDPQESEALFRDLLIGVTQFFRDPAVFEALQKSVITEIVKQKKDDGAVRVWIPACSTGEEAYSLAILLREAMEQHGVSPTVQIFGTDIDDRAVDFARLGRYGRTIGLSAERLSRWFIEDNGEFYPKSQIREMCVFSVHNVIKDPPFSKLDLISCRNLLIYMSSELQDRVLRTFHYALNRKGVLLLGPSEGASRQAKLYAVADKVHHIFRRLDADAAFPSLPMSAPSLTAGPLISAVSQGPAGNDRLDRGARRALAKYSPVFLVIDKDHQILRFSGGEAGRYLEPSAGTASLNIFSNLRKILRPIVRTAVHAVGATNKAVVNEDIVVEIDGQKRLLTIIVEPIADGGEAGICVVAFRETAFIEGQIPSIANAKGESGKMRAVEHELRMARAQLQATIDDLETANEEMKSASEEYQSVNEELQSTNEELETSKEEMQSVNEELQTVNAEMLSKNELLTQLNSDLKNLLDSTQIATIFLDEHLRIKNFTPGMVEIFSLRDGDRGRPLTDIVSLLAYDELRQDVAKVIRQLTVIERELQLHDKEAAFIMRIRPYRSVENVIDGVVITFIDITDRRKVDYALLASEVRFSAIVNQAAVGVTETDLSGRYLLTNARFEALVGRSGEELFSLRMSDLTHPDDLERMTALMDRLAEDGVPFEIEQRYVRPDGSAVWVHNSVSVLLDRDGRPHRLLAITLEIGERKRAEAQTGLLLGELDHRVKNILNIVTSVVTQTLKRNRNPEVFAAALQGRIAAIARAHSTLTEHGGRSEASFRDLIATELAPYTEGRMISIDGAELLLTPRAGLSLALAVHELASNAVKYGSLSVAGGQLAVSWTMGDTAARILRFVWAETGGPAITVPPTQSGFGTILIERALTHEFDAVVDRAYLPTGLRCTIDLPLVADVGELQSGPFPAGIV